MCVSGLFLRTGAVCPPPLVLLHGLVTSTLSQLLTDKLREASVPGGGGRGFGG